MLIIVFLIVMAGLSRHHGLLVISCSNIITNVPVTLGACRPEPVSRSKITPVLLKLDIPMLACNAVSCHRHPLSPTSIGSGSRSVKYQSGISSSILISIILICIYSNIK